MKPLQEEVKGWTGLVDIAVNRVNGQAVGCSLVKGLEGSVLDHRSNKNNTNCSTHGIPFSVREREVGEGASCTPHSLMGTNGWIHRQCVPHLSLRQDPYIRAASVQRFGFVQTISSLKN